MLSPLTGELKSSQIFGHRLKTLAALAFVKVIAGMAFILKPKMIFYQCENNRCCISHIETSKVQRSLGHPNDLVGVVDSFHL